ncbi:hypothetical protein NHX12_027272 [Muraenolepis orangiensis]|uniref:Uncharacterized protein n=1 Tax=Muraenolepis orangiensis TaxID=630683 RepID=A0A9Q0EIN3_9TELE|nr:hypothetical protein NHX12_027272 [Muraenolepis orangiensis]
MSPEIFFTVSLVALKWTWNDERTDDDNDGRTDKQTDEQTDEQTDGRTQVSPVTAMMMMGPMASMYRGERSMCV